MPPPFDWSAKLTTNGRLPLVGEAEKLATGDAASRDEKARDNKIVVMVYVYPSLCPPVLLLSRMRSFIRIRYYPQHITYTETTILAIRII